jgi:phosphatidylserine/phosphatidylglycerophosphate/cardiolipin synthase-like enzyme
MIRTVCGALCAVALVLSVCSGTAVAATPQPGALFNNPTGSAAAKARLIDRFISSVNSAHRGSHIRVAAYSNDRKDIADALIAAHRRGVHVQILFNDNWTSYQTERLQRRLGSDVTQESFLRVCRSSCRGEKGNLHSKIYLFSHTGTARNVVMVGSVNLTGYGVKTQWNDLYTAVGKPALHKQFVTIFDQMKRDRPMDHPFRSTTADGFDTNFYPRYGTTAADDPIMGRLGKVRCNHVSGGAGIDGHTMIRINMYGWNGTRGVYLAKKVASLSRNGCNVKVIETNAGGKVVRILRGGGVEVKTPDRDRNNNGTVDLYTHEKWMILSGRYGGGSGWHVWTGSQNWSDRSLNGDEVTMHIPRRGAFSAYRQNFQLIWKPANSHHPKLAAQ